MTAVLGAVAVVAGTLLSVWLLRPGPPGTEGTGGLATRQPRATWLVVGTLAALGAYAWWARRGRHRRGARRGLVLALGALALLGGAAAAARWWPGGLLREYEPPFDPADLEEVPAPESSAPPGTAGAPTSAPATPTTAAATPTTAPSATTSGSP
ncbi:MAG: hypothetical protein KatS3mg009_2292 [Acidimicrobiia bacterium]|nr:MAG: hypothetical protein KatS3mg009_2292 [Acidimicrobiia bacterium]